jgi:uncharacterized integral membrane protein
MTNLIISIIVAFWVGAIALLSVQNATSVTLRFLQFQSISLPLGVVLSFCIASGMVGTAIVLVLGRSSRQSSERFLDDE